MIIHACPLSVDRFIPYRQQLPGGPFYALYSPKNSENIAKKTSVEDWMDKEIFGLLLALTRREFLYYVQVHFEYFLHTGLFFFLIRRIIVKNTYCGPIHFASLLYH